MNRSRLTRNLEKQTKRNFILAFIGILVLGYVMLTYALPFIINLSLFFEKSKDTQNSSSKKSHTYVSPPVLTTNFSATNSALVTIDGEGDEKETISLFVNDKLVDKTSVKENKTFSFENVALLEGSNTIKTKAKDSDDNESNFSENLTITYLKNPPNVSIDDPTDGKRFEKDQRVILVKGKSDPNTRVTINGFWAVSDADGNYHYNLSLHDGDNEIKATSVDDAGNKAEKQIKVTYAP